MDQAMSYEDLTNQDFLNQNNTSYPDLSNLVDQDLNKDLHDQTHEAHELPFYLMRPSPPEEQLNGSTNLILHNERQHAFKQYCCKKVKEPLSAFLPDFPGNIDTTAFFSSGDEAKETSTLNSLLDPKLQVVNKEIAILENSQLRMAFTLYQGPPIDEKYMVMVQSTLPSECKKERATSKKEKKKSKRSSNEGEANGEKRKKKKEKKKKKDKDKDKEKKSSTND